MKTFLDDNGRVVEEELCECCSSFFTPGINKCLCGFDMIQGDDKKAIFEKILNNLEKEKRARNG